MTENLLNAAQAADRLSTTADTLKTWRSQGKGPKYVKMGRSVRYRETDINEFINDRVIEHGAG